VSEIAVNPPAGHRAFLRISHIADNNDGGTGPDVGIMAAE
jgi:hypothetical protein